MKKWIVKWSISGIVHKVYFLDMKEAVDYMNKVIEERKEYYFNISLECE